jgi:GTPase SAR1 family protein
MLVGCKMDLRDDPATLKRLVETMEGVPTTVAEGDTMKRSIGAIDFLECSAFLKVNVREVFEVATRATLKRSSKKNKGCRLL